MEALKLFGGVTAFLAVIFVGFFYLAMSLNANQCAARAKLMNVNHMFSWKTGCMVEMAGGYIPLENVRVNAFKM